MIIIALLLFWIVFCMLTGSILPGTLIFIFVVVLCVVLGISSANKKDAAIKEAIEAYKKVNPFNEDATFRYRDYRVFFDKDNKKIIIFNGTQLVGNIPFDKLIDCKIRDNGNVVYGGVGRAVVGGAIAGGVGAVVGATTAKEKIVSYQLVFVCNNISNPEIVCDLITKKMEITRGDSTFSDASSFANKVCSAVRVVIERRNSVVN